MTSDTRPIQSSSSVVGLLLNIAVKVALVGLVVHSVVAADAPQFQEKAMLVRQLTFPLSMLVVPVVWLLLRPAGAYPHGLDVLVTLPCVIDLAGNATNAFNTIEYFDDAVHAVNPVLLVAAVTVVARRRGHSRSVVALIASGLGSTGHILFEIIEFQLFTGGNARLNLTLADTLSDLGWGIVGSIVGVVIALAGEPRQRRSAPGHRSDSPPR